ncbi:MAG: hypothetical protein BM565_08125 [Gammaproteobacteria bacterium MedPE]|nr:MAG: hypothetical protein BM565_08125 [Gammaproteobacteria bacterium MedPE]
MRTFQFITIVSLFLVSVLCNSSRANVYDQVSYKSGKTRVISGISHRANNYYKHLQTGITVYALATEYDANNPPLPEFCLVDASYYYELTVKLKNETLWHGKGIFDEPVFSPNGKTLWLTRHFDHQVQHIVITDGVVRSIPEPIESPFSDKKSHKNNLTTDHSCPSSNRENIRKISNNGKQQLHLVRNGYIRELHSCHGISYTVNEKCAEFKLHSTPVDITLGESNQIYVTSNSLVTRYDNQIPLWSKSLEDFTFQGNAQLTIYHNLLLVKSRNKLHLYDKHNGQLLYHRTKKQDNKIFKPFFQVFFQGSYLIFPFFDKNEHGRINIGQHLEYAQ